MPHLSEKLSKLLHIYTYIYIANELGNWSLIPGRVIPKTQKMVLDTSLLNTQHHMVCIKGKVEQSRVVAIEK